MLFIVVARRREARIYLSMGVPVQASSLKETIWQLVAGVPRGKVATYGQIAALAGCPAHARYVGTTLKNLPSGSRLPWHRIVNARGEVAFPAGSEAWERQKARLEAEGVVFLGGRVSLRRFQWQP